jgi:hypothetical protein
VPASEIFHKWKHHEALSNGQHIKSLAQAKAIASHYEDDDEDKKEPKKASDLFEDK